MKAITQWFIIGVLAIIFVFIFRAQSQTAENIVARLKTRDPEQYVIAAALTVALGLGLVVAGQAIRKFT